MGLQWLRLGKIVEKAASEATDLISAKHLNANDDVFAPMALAA
jgi:hypothetical protein